MKELIKYLLGFHKVLFCDLDGTLIKTKSGKTFPVDKFDWELRNEVIDAINNYMPDYVFIISNQGGIEKGFILESDFEHKIEHIVAEIGLRCLDVVQVDYAYCTSNDKQDPMRKPNTGMIDDFKEVFTFFNYQAMMIGDASGKEGQFSDSDKKTAENAGIRYMDVDDFVEKFKS